MDDLLIEELILRLIDKFVVFSKKANLAAYILPVITSHQLLILTCVLIHQALN